MPIYWDVGETVVSFNCIEWTIKNFFLMPLGLKDTIWSKKFSFKNKQFYIALSRMGSTNVGTDGWMEILLLSYSRCNFSEYTAYFGIRKRSREETESSRVNCEMGDEITYYKALRLLQWDTLLHNKEQLVPDGHLTILCSFRKDWDEPCEVKSRLSK